MSGARPPRRGFLVLGTAEATRDWAAALGAGFGDDALAVSVSEPHAVRPRELRLHLGKSLALVVLDAHAGLDPDALAACHGFVRAGGALVVRMPPEASPDPKLAAWPYTAADVGRRFEARARALFARRFEVVDASIDPSPLPRPPPVTHGTEEQAALVAALTCPAGGATVLMADRGRGKSAALGLAAKTLVATRRVAVTASSPDAAAEVLRFAPELPFIALEDLADHPLDVLIIDEAATLPVPSLRRLTLARPETHLVFMTTVHGYEGSGRGFALRFVPWLETQRRTVRHTLREPIRWAVDCPLERAIFEVLVLDAELPSLTSDISTIEMLDRQAISDTSPESERDLADLFGLLVHAHYRTSPSDLRRLLDAPNLAVHVARVGPERRIGAACLVAREGGFTPELSAEVAAGQRVQAHALADALVAHLGATEAGPMTMVRSVRIATHPALRRLGLARALVEHVHGHYDVDLFGTLFGAAADLLAFRRALGYRLVRVSASRNQRTGEPSVLMLRPVSARARTLVTGLECALARELPTQLELLRAEYLGLEPELAAALQEDLPAVEPYTDAEVMALVRAYAEGPRTFESVAAAVTRFIATADLSSLSEVERRVVESRALAHHTWEDAATHAGLAHAGLAMKTMRRAIRRLHLVFAGSALPPCELSAPTAITRPSEA